MKEILTIMITKNHCVDFVVAKAITKPFNLNY
jgi:hypothetical protein